MVDEEIPENIDLRFLATQNARILQELSEARTELGEIRAEQRRTNSRLDKLDETAVALEVTIATLVVGQRELRPDAESEPDAIADLKRRVERLERQAGLTTD